MADLAGSERVKKSECEERMWIDHALVVLLTVAPPAAHATGEVLEEAKKINQSLSALGNCIFALTSKATPSLVHGVLVLLGVLVCWVASHCALADFCLARQAKRRKANHTFRTETHV